MNFAKAGVRWISAACFAVLAACGAGGEGDATGQAASDRAANAVTPPGGASAAADEWTGTVEIVVSGGNRLAGTHRSDGAGCVRTLDGWIISHENVADRLRMTQAVLYGIEAAGSTPRFSLSVVFGDPMDETDRDAAMLLVSSDSPGSQGESTATVTRDGDMMIVAINGRTPDGIQVQARYRCRALQ
ncbi:hypothetical protein BH23GEM2_BH23GEM2_05610 [soil metagenome]